MSEATTLAVQKKGDAPAEWGDREDIIALSNRLKTMMPGDLSAQEALLLAQYSAAMDANPFRGEVYAYMSQGKLILTEGYKLLVRWARRQCQFYERYERITNNTDTIPEDAIAFRCRILRQDAVNDLARLTEAGIPDAYLILTTEAVGVVRKNETWSSKYNKPIAPPKGWTWEDVARKRALKNALNRAYGAPSPREIAQETWQVEDTLTIPEDWDTPGALLPAEAEANAKYNANRRLAQPSTQTFAESMDELGFPPDEETESPLEYFTRSQTPPETEPEEGKAVTTLADLLEDVNAILIEGALDTYSHTQHITNALKQLGYSGYKPMLHKEMVKKLVSRKMPPEAPRTPAGAEDGMGPVGPTAQKPTAATGDAPDANNVFPVDTISTWGEFWGAVFNNLGLNKTQALDIAEVNDQVELSGTDYQAKYMTVARAIDLRRASDRAAAERAAAG